MRPILDGFTLAHDLFLMLQTYLVTPRSLCDSTRRQDCMTKEPQEIDRGLLKVNLKRVSAPRSWQKRFATPGGDCAAYDSWCRGSPGLAEAEPG